MDVAVPPATKRAAIDVSINSDASTIKMNGPNVCKDGLGASRAIPNDSDHLARQSVTLCPTLRRFLELRVKKLF